MVKISIPCGMCMKEASLSKTFEFHQLLKKNKNLIIKQKHLSSLLSTFWVISSRSSFKLTSTNLLTLLLATMCLWIWCNKKNTEEEVTIYFISVPGKGSSSKIHFPYRLSFRIQPVVVQLDKSCTSLASLIDSKKTKVFLEWSSWH